eukprot:g18348.t1
MEGKKYYQNHYTYEIDSDGDAPEIDSDGDAAEGANFPFSSRQGTASFADLLGASGPASFVNIVHDKPPDKEKVVVEKADHPEKWLGGRHQVKGGRKGCTCPLYWKPVCGKDAKGKQKTYPTPCQMNCFDGVTKVSDGKCLRRIRS